MSKTSEKITWVHKIREFEKKPRLMLVGEQSRRGFEWKRDDLAYNFSQFDNGEGREREKTQGRKIEKKKKKNE